MKSPHRFVCQLALGTLGACGAALALTDPATVSIEVTQTAGATLAAAPNPAAPGAPAWPQADDLATQTMLWRQRGRVGFGVGIEHRGHAAGPGLSLPPVASDALLVGVSLATSERTRLSLQTPATGLSDTPFTQRPVKVALSFEVTDRLRQLRRGSLARMELSGQTSLSLRARGGRIGLALTSRW